MLIGDDQFVVHTGTAVKNWHKLHLKASIAGRKSPRLAIIVLWDVEGHIIDLVCHAIIKDDIFSRRLGIAKSVADIEAKGMPI